tara:strand:- start:307 stop:606 length:300 start_codon:yes stop_codon:yes gene_type:complete
MEDNKKWEDISEELSKVKKNVKNSLNEENIIDDLKESLFDSLQNTSKLLKTILENIDSTIKDDEIRKDTKEVINKINSEVVETLKSSGLRIKDNLFEEE